MRKSTEISSDIVPASSSPIPPPDPESGVSKDGMSEEDLGEPGFRIAVLIPALNEEDALPSVLTAIPVEVVGEVVVVDNGSTDRTVDLAKGHGATVLHEAEKGYGAACLRGLDYLFHRTPPPHIVVFLDADHSEDPREIQLLIDPIQAGQADMVLGVRRGEQEGRGVPLHARLGNWLVLTLAKILFREQFQDLPPFRAISLPALQRLDMDDRNWGWTLQMQLRAIKTDLRVLEVPINHRSRIAGKSKISGTVSGTVKVGTKMMWTLFRERLRR